jgi:ABC-type Fe3+/spermidine/putrescine transport system ATPase subunit
MIPILEISDLTHRYDSAIVLEGFSLSVMTGRHMALIGPSGCGKSTVLRLIAGLEIPDRGTIHIHGDLVTDGCRIMVPPSKRGISMVFQDLALWPNLSALANIELGLASSRLSKRERLASARHSLELCRIPDLADRKPSQLSGGQQQRVALARALVVRPSLLLLDEPFTGMDDELKEKLIEELQKLSNENGITVLIATHDFREAEALECAVHRMKNASAGHC